MNAVNLAAKLNAYSAFTGIMTAAVTVADDELSATVTMTATQPGIAGNLLVANANVNLANSTFVSWGSATAGTDGTEYTVNLA